MKPRNSFRILADIAFATCKAYLLVRAAVAAVAIIVAGAYALRLGFEERPMTDAEIVALREKLTSRRAPSMIGRAAEISMNVVWLMDCSRM